MKGQAFTLIELLVTIAVIAVLTGILLPSLGTARNQCKAVHCLSNLRQFVFAAQAYATNNDGYYPISRFKLKQADVMYQYYWDFTRIKRNGTWSTIPGLLWMDKTIEQIHQCPAFRGASNSADDPYTGYNYNVSFIGHGDGENISSNYPGAVMRFQWKPGFYSTIVMPARYCSVSNPSGCAIFGDGQWKGGANKFMRAPEPWSGDNNALLKAAGVQGFRHNARTNIAWCDGHVSSQKEYYTDTIPNEKAKLDEYNANAAVKIGFISPDNSAYDLK